MRRVTLQYKNENWLEAFVSLQKMCINQNAFWKWIKLYCVILETSLASLALLLFGITVLEPKKTFSPFNLCSSTSIKKKLNKMFVLRTRQEPKEEILCQEYCALQAGETSWRLSHCATRCLRILRGHQQCYPNWFLGCGWANFPALTAQAYDQSEQRAFCTTMCHIHGNMPGNQSLEQFSFLTATRMHPMWLWFIFYRITMRLKFL